MHHSTTTAAALALLALGAMSTVPAAPAAAQVPLDIPASDLPTALKLLAQQADLQLVYVPTATDSTLRTDAIKGRFTTDQALRIVLANTNLTYTANDKDTIVVTRGELRASHGDDAANRSSAENSGLEEITVSARRRQESQRDVPLSLVVKSGADLAAARVKDLSELERVVPGMVYGGLSMTPLPSIFLRGVGAFSTSTGVDPSVGIAIDGVVTPRSSVLSSDFGDIERIEVLRGPQGTLFGKNSSAGLVSVVTQDPGDTWTGRVRMGVGSYDEVRANATVSGPLVGDELLGGVSLYTDKRDGYLYNIGLGRKVLDDNQRGARGTFLYRPSDATRVRFSLYAVERKNDWSHSLLPAYTVGPNSSPLDRELLGPIAGPQNATIWTTGDGGIDYFTRTRGTTLQWDQKLGDFSLTSITAYQDWFWRQYWGGITDGPAPYLLRAVNDATNDTSQWSQELRIASPTGRRIDYVAGLYLYYMRFGSTNEHRFVPNATTLQFNSSASLVDTYNYAAFGEMNYHLTDTVTLIAGTRFTHEQKDYWALGRPLPSDCGYPTCTGFLLSSHPGVMEDSANVNSWSWRGGVRWEPSSRQMLYATAARGFKGAGFNSVPSTGTSEKVRPEVATTVEIGAKSTWLDRRLQTNVAVYHSLFKDAQSEAFALQEFPGGVTVSNYVLTNAGELRSQGVELELQAMPIDGLTLGLNGAFVDAIYKEYTGAQCYSGQTAAQGCVGGKQDLSGTRLPLAPKWSGTFTTSYDVKLGALPFDGFIRADYSWRSDVQYSRANAPNSIEEAYGLLGATLGVRSKDDRYSISIYGKNLTDQFHVAGLGRGGGGLGTSTQQISPDYQRIWGAEFTYNFQ